MVGPVCSRIRCFRLSPSSFSITMKGWPFVFLDIVNRADVRMIELRSRSRLARKALQRALVSDQMIGNELQRDMPPQAHIFRLIDNSHPAAAELPKHAVVGNGLTHHIHERVARTCLELVEGHARAEVRMLERPPTGVNQQSGPSIVGRKNVCQSEEEEISGPRIARDPEHNVRNRRKETTSRRTS